MNYSEIRREANDEIIKIIFSKNKDLTEIDQRNISGALTALSSDRNNEIEVPYRLMMERIYSMSDKTVRKYKKYFGLKIQHIDNSNIKVNKFKHDFYNDLQAILITRHHFSQSINNLKNTFSDSLRTSLDKIKGRIYTNLITILGLFVAIMAAVFGGLQLFGSVFRNVDKLSHNGLGKAIILGSIIIFGTYLILILLFKGISRLTKRYNYQLPISFTIYFISSLIILFLLGTIIAYPKICVIIEIHFKCISIIIGIMVFIVFINILIMGYEIHAFKRIEKKILRFKDHRQKRKYIKEYKPFDYFKPFKY